MNILLETRLFALLSEPSQTVLTNEISDAYKQFTEQTMTVCNSGNNAMIYRILNIARIGFSELNTIHQYGQGEKYA